MGLGAQPLRPVHHAGGAVGGDDAARTDLGAGLQPQPGAVIPEVLAGQHPGRQVGVHQGVGLPSRAQVPQVGRRLDHRAVSEGHRAGPEEQPVAAGQANAPGGRREPGDITGDRQQPGGHRGGGGPPSGPPYQQVARHQPDENQGGGPDHRRQAQQQRPGGGPGRGREPAGEQHREAGHHQEHGQDVGHHVLLQQQLRRVEKHRRGRRGGQPRARAPAPQDRVDHDRDGQPHQVLQARDQHQGVKRLEQPQEDGVPAGVDRVRLQVGGVPQVVVGVQLEQRGRRETSHHDDPQGDAGGHRGGGEPVPPGQREQPGQRPPPGQHHRMQQPPQPGRAAG